LALKKPIISFKNSGGVAEMLEDRGVLVENMDSSSLADAIADLVKNKQFMRNLLKDFKSFKWDSNVSKEKIKSLVSNIFEKFIYNLEGQYDSEKKISIVLPSYNQEDYISEAIDSVINQTYGNWELIVVDDNSVDKTQSIIKKYVKSYPDKIRLIIKDRRKKGLALSYERGIKECSGEYVSFLEGDDVWKKDNLMKKIKIFLQYPEVGCVFSNVQSFGQDSLLVERNEDVSYFFRDVSIPSGPFDMCKLIKNKLPVKSFSSLIVRRSLLKGIDFSNDYDVWFDWWFNAQLSLLSKYFYLNEKTVKWRVHSKSYFEDYKRNNDIRNRYLLIQKKIIDYLEKN